MAKKKQGIPHNYLEKIPLHKEGLDWSEEDGSIVLHMPNRGIVKKITQVIFKKPKVSHIHLDEMGSFVWPLIDGKTDIIGIGEAVKEHFGEKAEPLYPRLAQYFKVLESYSFIEYK